MTWFTESIANKIAKMTMKGKVTTFLVPTPYAELYMITAGSDGNLWFTEAEGNKIGRITPSGKITEFPVPGKSPSPEAITAEPDGLWFAETDPSSKIGRITTSGKFTIFTVKPHEDDIADLTPGAKGQTWFTMFFANRIGRLKI